MADSPSADLPIGDPLELARSGRLEQLARQARAARATAGWNARGALELACAWLLAGDLRQADLAYLEADQLDPSLALVPDVWGLWPAPAGPAAGGDAVARELAHRWCAWRHGDPQAQWQQLLPRLQADWRQALEPETGDALRVLGRLSAGAPALDPPLEPELARLVADAEIAAEPAASSRYWQLVASLRPQWDLARIRAADLALARGELEAAARWLAEPPAEALANPWFHDVAARHAVARGAIGEALDAWAAALHAAQASPNTAGLADVFEQRRREARRGPGLLQVRSLASRGEAEAARQLLNRLVEEDPQWQPLRRLQEQLRTAPQPPLPASRPAAPANAAAAPTDLEAFTALLDRAGARLQALGHALPPPRGGSPPADPAAALAELEAYAQRLSGYEARYALA